MNLNPKFIRYEKNNDPDAKFVGIATISICDNKVILRFKVQAGKEGRGLFFTPFSAKMHDQWVNSFTIDSNFESEEIMAMIRTGMNQAAKPSYAQPQANQGSFSDMTIDDGKVPF